MKKLLTGSKSWFITFDNFKPHDTDYFIILENNEKIDTSILKNIEIENKEITDGKFGFGVYYIKDEINNICYFIDFYRDKQTLLQHYLMSGNVNSLSALCNPIIAKELNLTISDLKEFDKIIDAIHASYSYIKYIYECTIKNNDFHLTKEQLNEAYNIYKKTKHPDDYK